VYDFKAPPSCQPNLASHGHGQPRDTAHQGECCLSGTLSTGSIEVQVQQLSASQFLSQQKMQQVYMVQQAVSSRCRHCFPTSISLPAPPSIQLQPAATPYSPCVCSCCPHLAHSRAHPSLPPHVPQGVVCPPPLVSTYLVGASLYLPDVKPALLLVITKYMSLTWTGCSRLTPS